MDGLLGGRGSPAFRHDFWNYEFMSAGFLLALPLSALLGLGAVVTLHGALTCPTPRRRILFAFELTAIYALLYSFATLTLSLPFFSQAKASYLLPLLLPLALGFGRGVGAIDRRLEKVGPEARGIFNRRRRDWPAGPLAGLRGLSGPAKGDRSRSSGPIGPNQLRIGSPSLDPCSNSPFSRIAAPGSRSTASSSCICGGSSRRVVSRRGASSPRVAPWPRRWASLGNTVNQAYQGLVEDGLLRAHVGQGTFVAGRLREVASAEGEAPKPFAWEGLASRRLRRLQVPAGAVPKRAVRHDLSPGQVDRASLPGVGAEARLRTRARAGRVARRRGGPARLAAAASRPRAHPGVPRRVL